MYMYLIFLALVQIMACRLIGAKPLSEPMLEYDISLHSRITINRWFSVPTGGWIKFNEVFVVTILTENPP